MPPYTICRYKLSSLVSDGICATSQNHELCTDLGSAKTVFLYFVLNRLVIPLITIIEKYIFPEITIHSNCWEASDRISYL